MDIVYCNNKLDISSDELVHKEEYYIYFLSRRHLPMLPDIGHLPLKTVLISQLSLKQPYVNT